MNTLWQDLRFGLRMLTKNPGFTTVAVVTLALGIGANTAIFSVVNAVLLRPLPYKNADRLMAVWSTNKELGEDHNNASDRSFVAWRDRNQVFDDIAGYVGWSFTLTGGGEPEKLNGALVTAGFFSTLGAEPMLGRGFTKGEDQPGKEDVAVLGFGLWKRRFASDRNIVGKTLTLDGKSVEIVGVMPRDFHSPGGEFNLWKPVALDANAKISKGIYQTIARLKPGITQAQAQAQLDSMAAQLQHEVPDKFAGQGVRIVPLHEQTVGDVRSVFLILLGAVGFVLLIACANVANLLLARATVRAKEIAIRTALGAGRWRVTRQLLTESLVLAVAGGAVGVFLALWGVDSLVALSPAGIPRLEEVKVDGQVLLFLLGISLLTGVIFGLAPAIQIARNDQQTMLKEGGRSTGAGGGRARLRNLLVIGEVALSFTLLIGAGLLIRSFFRLSSVDSGFNVKNVLTAPVWLNPTKYEEPQAQVNFSGNAIEKISRLPGVQSAAAAMILPLSGSDAITSVTIEDRAAAPESEQPRPGINVITPAYFKTMGIPLLHGRDVAESDTANGLPVVIINDELARAAWPGQDPVGKRLVIGRPRPDNPWLTVAGVAGNTHSVALETAAGPEIYLPYRQTPFAFPFMTFVIRTANDPVSLIAAARREIWSVDKDQPLYDIKTMEQRISESVARPRFQFLLLSIFAGVALILAAVGLYGVMAYSVTQRTHEVGIRMALGAESTEILKLVLKQGLSLSAIGIVIGLTGAFLLTRVMESLVFGVSTKDALTFSGVALLLAAVAVVATYIPARRATKVDPMVALRYE